MGRFRIGNSGWSYKDWIGPFYPAGSKMAELLSIYFSRFDTVEVNSTFYNLPRRETVERWAKEASRWRGREVCVKVPGEISHQAAMMEDPSGLFTGLKSFKDAVLRPLTDAGVIGAVLFQASPYFTMRGDIKYKMKAEPKVPLPEYILGLKRLSEVCEGLASLPGDHVIELRNSSWLTEENRLLKEARDCLRQNGVALAVVDGPSFPWLEEETSRHNYIRFHGRNKEDWFKGGLNGPTERYTYRYTVDELMQRRDRIKVLDSKVDKATRVIFNNHPRGYAPNNAIEMREVLGVQPPVSAFEGFV